jgi:hypothetical protein
VSGAGRRWVRLVAGTLGVLAVAAALGGLTRLPYRASAGEAAALRLTWRARVPRVEECRRLTPEEQAALPAHMRREEVCEGRVASYLLRVAVDGEVRREVRVEGAGARGDRPLYVFETVPVRAGRHRVEVTFERIGAAAAPAGDAGRDHVPDRLALDAEVRVAAREILLVRYDAGGRRLVLQRADAAGG